METVSLCLLISATLSIQPDRTQFFRYEAFSLNCAVPGNFNGWAVRRNTSMGLRVLCEDGWGRPNGSSCINNRAYSADSGLYWCESEKECSNTLNITVNIGVVILESPALPVTEGDNVALRCSYKERYDEYSSSDFFATFYKDDVFIGKYARGEMILKNVPMSVNGFYNCEHPEHGKSPKSWLSVRARAQPSSEPPLMSLSNLVSTILLFLLYTAIAMLCIYTYRKWARAQAEAKRREPDHL
uniref:Ig-like domain-containing protein n=2 Tax=Astatotilapia calliptera TaxID=8154 RepID=A0AAX7W0Q7_ASTCA